MADNHERQTVPVTREELEVERRWRETGRVSITTRVEREPVTLEEPVEREELEVERVPMGYPVGRPRGPRTEGDTTIIPVYEERLVVQRQLYLVEEVHVHRRRRREMRRAEAERRVERVEVTRDEPDQRSEPDERHERSAIAEREPRTGAERGPR